jgi:hypothetical protein
MKKKIKDIFLYFLIAIPTVYILLLLFLYFYQRNLLYHPNENNYFGDNLKIEVDRIKIKTSDNLDLNAWYYEKDKNKFKTLLFFHGNAGLLENRIYKLNALDKLDLNILIIAWRGFSGNEGKPNEKGLYEDGKSAIDWLLNNGVKERNIILYGESLGTGIATHLAQKRDFAGVILETPFTSMIDAAKTFYPYVPVNILLKDRYENKNKIMNINSPILIMHGEIDNIVPFHMGKKLFEIANEPKTFYSTKTDNHMMEYDDKLINELDIFIKSLN